MATSLFSLVGKIALDGMTRFNNDLKAGEAKTKDLQKALGMLGANLTKVGSSLSKNITAPLAGVGVAIGALALKTASYASDLLSLSEASGLSTDALQEYEHIAKVAGVSSDAFIAAITKISPQLEDIKNGSGAAAVAMDKLGISVTNSDGTLRSMDELLPDIIGSLNKVDDVNQRNAIAADIFGKKLKDVAPVLGMTSEELEKVRKSAHDTGKIMGEDALKSADQFRISVENLKKDFSILGMEIGSAFIPILRDQVMPLIEKNIIPALKSLADMVRGVATWFGGLNPALQNTAIVIGAAAAAMGPVLLIAGKMLLSIKALIPVFTTLITVIKSAWVALAANPIGITIAAVAALGIAIYQAIKAFQDLKKAKALAAEADSITKTTGELMGQVRATESAVKAYEKLKGTQDFNPAELERLTAEHVAAAIAIKQHAREAGGLAAMTDAERKATEESVRAKLAGVKALKDTAAAAKEAAQTTDLQRAQIAKEAEERQKAYAKRKQELDDLVKDNANKLNKMFLTAEQYNELEEEAAIEKAKRLGATESQISEIRKAYYAERAKMANEAMAKEAEAEEERLKKIADLNAEWQNKVLQQRGNKSEILESEYVAAIKNAEKIGAETFEIEQYYERERLNLAKEENKKIADANKEWVDKLKKQELDGMKDRFAARKIELDIEEADALSKATETGADTLQIQAYFAKERVRVEKEANEKIDADRKKSVSMWADAIVGSVNKIGSIMNTFTANEEKRVSKEYKERREYIEANVKDETKRNAALEALAKEEDAKKLSLQKKQAGREKALGIFNTVIDTARAAIKMLADPGGIAGAIMSAASIAIGVAQTAAIASTPEPFAAGGLITGGRGGVYSQVGEGKQDELILPMETGVERLAEELASQGSAGGDTYTYNVSVNVGNMIADERGIKTLGRKIREVIISEDRRTGV